MPDDIVEMLDRPRSRRYAKRVRSTTAQLAEAVESCRGDIEAILGKKALTDEAKAKRISKRRAELLDEVDAIEAKAEKNLEVARSGSPKQKVPRDPGQAALLESRKTRAWSRAERLLDTGKDPDAVARFFADQGDRLGLEALKEELGVWMNARTENAARAKERTAEELSVIREIEKPLLSEGEAEMVTGLEEAERAAGDLKLNAGLLRREGENVNVLSGEDDDGGAVTFDLGAFGPREEAMLARNARTGVLHQVLCGGQLPNNDND